MPKNALNATWFGLAAAVIGAALWAAITVATGYQIGFMAIGVGFLCGYAVGRFGRGSGPVYGVIGGACALFGCALGNLWSAFGMVAKETEISFFKLLFDFDYSLTFEILSEQFTPIDVLFYGLAAWEGFKLASSGKWNADATAVPA